MTTAFQEDAFEFDAFQIDGAQYKLLQPHFINNIWLDQGTIVNEGLEIPDGWTPTLAVDPLNDPALQAFYAAGPRRQDWDTFNEFGLENFVSTPQIKPVTYWVQTSPGVWQLTGIGALLAPVRL